MSIRKEDHDTRRRHFVGIVIKNYYTKMNFNEGRRYIQRYFLFEYKFLKSE